MRRTFGTVDLEIDDPREGESGDRLRLLYLGVELIDGAVLTTTTARKQNKQQRIVEFVATSLNQRKMLVFVNY